MTALPPPPVSRRLVPLVPLLSVLLLGGCMVGPDYVRPAPPVAAQQPFEEADGRWTPAAPAAADPAVAWWTRYGDPQLDALVEQADRANQTLRQAEARYRQAQALVGSARAAETPTLGVQAAATRERSVTPKPGLRDADTLGFSASWEPDFWGKVRRSVEQAGDNAQASAADLAQARLSLQAAVVADYLQLRFDDQTLALYQRTLAGYRDALRLTQARVRAGVASAADVAAAEATLHSTEAASTDLALSRRQLDHALAVLLGHTPAEFSLAASDAPLPALPPTPQALPSVLLQRRPDIAGAERRMAAANAGIGIAVAAWFPTLSLSASGGYDGAGLASLLSVPNRVWAVGAALAGTLFDGGARHAQRAQAQATFDAAAATYRQTVLSAFQGVEDQLAATRELAREQQQQRSAADAAQQAERVLMDQYRAGTALYSAVITAQANALDAQRTLLQVQARQFGAQVALLVALGGDWDSARLPAVRGASPGATPAPVLPE
ncbi:efflux transporter outer membrane subunit [uncultured Xanthomonas sp.]|uniref:efflux transporter outer membrane subunit n=1 Tax=uncultured Xanthomonas sp. TaxID=152831 RepID=UPI0025D2718F|nr:efflux transporter outer membrane subunit [uncultured Xanthomonas sp.]